MKHGKVSIKSLFLAVLIFGAMITGLSSFATEIGGNYNQTQTFPAFDKENEINSTMASFMSQISSGNIFVAAAAFFLMPVTIVSIMIQSWGFVAAMISEGISGATGLMLPSWFGGLIMTGAFIVMLFALWNAITGRRES